MFVRQGGSRMSNTVGVTIPVDLEAAQALKSSARRDAAGRFLSGLLKESPARALLEEAIRQCVFHAMVNGVSTGS
jgi:hypothetical protein